MHSPSISMAQGRENPFSRISLSPSPAPRETSARRPSRPKSVAFAPPAQSHSLGHTRTSSFNPSGSNGFLGSLGRQRSNSARNTNHSSNTFAPQFIKSEELQKGADQIRGQEGDNDFSGKRYVWLKDAQRAFIRGLVLEELESGILVVQCEDGSVSVTRSLIVLFLHRLTSYMPRHARSTSTMLTRLILRSLTKPTTWRSLRTSMRPPSFIICTVGINQI